MVDTPPALQWHGIQAVRLYAAKEALRNLLKAYGLDASARYGAASEHDMHDKITKAVLLASDHAAEAAGYNLVRGPKRGRPERRPPRAPSIDNIEEL